MKRQDTKDKPKREKKPPNEKPLRVDLPFEQLLKLAAHTKSPTARSSRAK